MVLENDDTLKKSEQILIRVEPDVRDFYQAEARLRRIPLSQIIRELLYKNMEEKLKGKPHGVL